jgi:NADH-quinone oxidoreductase subunit A
MSSPTSIVAYLALFAAMGFAFLFINLLVGRFLRPQDPTPEKLEVYECGEPTIGSSFVQFDLRFYVVALLFIIFDVEVAFFFPWATVFGKATHLMDPHLAKVTAEAELTPAAAGLFEELGLEHATSASVDGRIVSEKRGDAEVEQLARRIAQISVLDILAFFAVLLVGFAYVWKRGDLDWVRALSKERAMASPRLTRISEDEHVLSA